MRVPYTCDCGGMLDVLPGGRVWLCNKCLSEFTKEFFEWTARCTCPLCLAADQPDQQGDDRKDHQDDQEDAQGPPCVDFSGKRVEHEANVPSSGGV